MQTTPSVTGCGLSRRGYAAQVHPKIVSEALGHSSVAFTMDTYQHLLPTMGDQVAAAIEEALGGNQRLR